MSLHGIDQRLIAGYRPQADGQVERFNRTILQCLRKCTGDNPERWIDWLEYVLLAIRTAVNSTTGFSPFQLLFGREFNPLADYTIMEWGSGQNDQDQLCLVEALVHRTQHLRQALEWQGRAIAQAQVAQVCQRRAEDAAVIISHVRLGAGAHVYLRTVHPDHKLVHRFVGPYVVVRDAVASSMTPSERLSANYIIADLLGVERAKSFPRDQLFAVAHAPVG